MALQIIEAAALCLLGGAATAGLTWLGQKITDPD